VERPRAGETEARTPGNAGRSRLPLVGMFEDVGHGLMHANLQVTGPALREPMLSCDRRRVPALAELNLDTLPERSAAR